jgi:type IV pilus assembly protein PilA
MRRRTRKLAGERGFTLVEILVCMLILAILAVIAMPAWLDQRAKGEDSEAKLTIRTAVTALHTHEHDKGTYDATPAQLKAIEPSLDGSVDLRIDGSANEYEIRETSKNETEFWYIRESDGTVTRDCSNHGHGLCRGDADSHGDYW